MEPDPNHLVLLPSMSPWERGAVLATWPGLPFPGRPPRRLDDLLTACRLASLTHYTTLQLRLCLSLSTRTCTGTRFSTCSARPAPAPAPALPLGQRAWYPLRLLSLSLSLWHGCPAGPTSLAEHRALPPPPALVKCTDVHARVVRPRVLLASTTLVCPEATLRIDRALFLDVISRWAWRRSYGLCFTMQGGICI